MTGGAFLTAMFLAMQAPAAADGAACADCLTVPALTPVQIELLAPLSSETSKTGQSFPIRLAAPVIIAGREVIPNGVAGLGEVVHAKKSGYGGTPGELVIAARHLDIAGRTIKLRSLRAVRSGTSRIAEANLAYALGIYIPRGGSLAIAEGTIAEAKTAEAFTIKPAPIQTAAEGGAPIEATVPAKGNEQP